MSKHVLILLAVTLLELTLTACQVSLTSTPAPTSAPTVTFTPINTVTPTPTSTATSTATNTATPRPTSTATSTATKTATPRPTNTATPRPTGKVDTGMGGNLSIQGIVRDNHGVVAPNVYVTIAVYGERGGWGIRQLGGWYLYTDKTGSFSFNNILRVERGHYEVQLNGGQEYGKVYEQSCYWIDANEISGDVYVLNVAVHPVTGSVFSGVIRYEDLDGSIKDFYSSPFIRPEPDHVIELVRGTPNNLEYSIGVQYCTTDNNTTKWRHLAGGTYHLKITFRTSDRVVRQCWSPPFEVPHGETKQFEYTIRNCPPLKGWIAEP